MFRKSVDSSNFEWLGLVVMCIGDEEEYLSLNVWSPNFCLLGTFQLRLFVRRTDFFICLSCDIILVQYFDHK